MQTAPTSKSNEPAAPAERHGYPSLEAVIRTDERYGNDSLFGRVSGMLAYPSQVLGKS